MANARTTTSSEVRKLRRAAEYALACGASPEQLREAVDTVGLVTFANGLARGASPETVLAAGRVARRLG
ncbi:hypothetical protein AB0L00_10645 [Actinoallomurus sp. NPDC052308]|uniref:hypothetical protein n=1 Tax=Actinoallomurus sp. NPDC052308 TaxID=3155530 RepID=UPI00343901BA